LKIKSENVTSESEEDELKDSSVPSEMNYRKRDLEVEFKKEMKLYKMIVTWMCKMIEKER